MIQIDEQRRIIEQIQRLILVSLPNEFESARCRLELTQSDVGGGFSVGSALAYRINGVENYDRVLRYPDSIILDQIVPDLHSRMRSQTGGDWQWMTIEISADRGITVNFDYPEVGVERFPTLDLWAARYPNARLRN